MTFNEKPSNWDHEHGYDEIDEDKRTDIEPYPYHIFGNCPHTLDLEFVNVSILKLKSENVTSAMQNDKLCNDS